ncbi:MAG: cytochrome P450 [Nocardioidaceae bacterium]
MHSYPAARDRLLRTDDDPAAVERFVQEVRRFYPFFPFVAARPAREFDWGGEHFTTGQRVLLDLYGTNHDPRLWEAPGEFRPERFGDWDGGAFDFIPQGGGDHDLGHRCAGEWVTIELMKVAVTALTRGMSYAVPPQDLRVPMRHAPTAPRSRFVLSVQHRR